MKLLPKYSIGAGDRFGMQGDAQLKALEKIRALGFEIVPVWNKSFREHKIIGTAPGDVRKEADESVKRRGWKHEYFVDADHIGLQNVDWFIDASDYFTLDVAEFIGKPPDENALEAFVDANARFLGDLSIPGIEEPFTVTNGELRRIGEMYLSAAKEAGRIYRYIREHKKSNFTIEVSTDEATEPQSPIELFFILSMLSSEGIPAQTIAPKFTGRFLKGVDYIGDVERFSREFEYDLAVIGFAVENFQLPENLKISIHSGSDKFSLYPVIRRILKKTGAGFHLKTAGTTWLEELAGLAQSEGQGLTLAQRIYRASYERQEELCKPYRAVINIDPCELPAPEDVEHWSSDRFVRSLEHNPSDSLFNPNLRQLLHVGYKVAAEMRDEFQEAVLSGASLIGERVTDNLYRKHLAPLLSKG